MRAVQELARLVFDHAQLGAEGKLDDAPGYLKRVNALLTELSDSRTNDWPNRRTMVLVAPQAPPEVKIW